MIDKILDKLCFILELLDLILPFIFWTMLSLVVTFVLITLVFLGFQYSTSVGIIVLIFVLSFLSVLKGK